MALVQLRDVVVSRVNRTGNGVKVLEESTSNGKTYKTYFSVWFTESHGLSEGDRVSLSGFLGAKIGEPWTDRDGNTRTSVELSVNNPRLSGVAEPVAPVVESAPSWNSETPF
jgi:hypothetical protein